MWADLKEHPGHVFVLDDIPLLHKQPQALQTAMEHSLVTGLRARGEVLRFDPAPPPEVRRLRFSVHYRSHRLDVTLTKDHMEIRSRPGALQPITVSVHGESVDLKPGDRHHFLFSAQS